MKLDTKDDVLELLRSYVPSAALSAALELGVFWLLEEQPCTVESVARELNIPDKRCYFWLELLASYGLLERHGDTYVVSPLTRHAITGTYSPETWSLLAQEARERYPAGIDLSLNLSHNASIWPVIGRTPPDYVAQMMENPERARRFTRMLFEIHRPLAEELAQILDLSRFHRLMDLGGGSGVISLALLRHNPDLTATVVDIPNVCAAGEEIVAGTPEAERITFHPADFLHDELPAGFDVVLECDVGIYNEDLFRRLAATLNDSGRLVIVDELAEEGQVGSPSSLSHAFYVSLHNPEFTLPSVNGVCGYLEQAGFHLIAIQKLTSGETVIQAEKR